MTWQRLIVIGTSLGAERRVSRRFKHSECIATMKIGDHKIYATVQRAAYARSIHEKSKRSDACNGVMSFKVVHGAYSLSEETLPKMCRSGADDLGVRGRADEPRAVAVGPKMWRAKPTSELMLVIQQLYEQELQIVNALSCDAGLVDTRSDHLARVSGLFSTQETREGQGERVSHQAHAHSLTSANILVLALGKEPGQLAEENDRL
ncbi:hypothetical protein BGW80DRAFT_1248821 [Lactifluus volemus]|nr:hypothetical protein BGW80DRAFT_1248821 [Lactifluus volemus]